MTRVNFANNKIKNTASVIMGLVIVLVLVLPTTVMPNVNALTSLSTPAKWVHQKMVLHAQSKIKPDTLIHYELISASDCTHAAKTTNQCIGVDTSYGTFKYTAPGSYGITGSCLYPCESQDVIADYPTTFTYNDVVYYFDNAQQEQCTTDDSWCSTTSSWDSTVSPPISVPYSGTPVGTGVEIDTAYIYKDSLGINSVEVEFVYTLDNGYGFG